MQISTVFLRTGRTFVSFAECLINRYFYVDTRYDRSVYLSESLNFLNIRIHTYTHTHTRSSYQYGNLLV